MAYREYHLINSASDLFINDEAIDISISSISLAAPCPTEHGTEGAHDPTPTPYFVLEELFGLYEFAETSRLLDVGCGAGRVLAHFLSNGFAGRADGIELDPALAAAARKWAARHEHLRVLEGSVLDLDLSGYTDFYLFNPFDADVLVKFIEKVEAEVHHPVTLIHMSDNGDTWWYVGRPGWSVMASGEFQNYLSASGRSIKIYKAPQHWTAWRYEQSRG